MARAAAVLAIFATFLGVSRLRLGQREHRRQLVADQAAREEAIARHIMDLSSKASEQLGSDNAATRIGGLNALERLAQTHSELRQTVVDQICAYLRRPYQPHPGCTRTRASTWPFTESDPGQARAADDEVAERDDTVAARRLELAVRRTAQQILARHLAWPATYPDRPSTFWEAIDLDLRDAVLVELDLAHCRVHFADFGDADFHGEAYFAGTTFGSLARFDGSTFRGHADFTGVTFGRAVVFAQAIFNNRTEFIGSTFGGDVSFDGATFAETVYFSGDSYAGRRGPTFDRLALFQDVKFNGDARFEQATFNWSVSFQQATFARRAEFSEATFVMDDQPAMWTADPADPQKVVAVDAAYMNLFINARVVDLERCSHTWPPGWQPMPNHLEPDGTALLWFNIKVLLDDSEESGLDRQPTSPQPDPTPSTTISGDHSRRAAWRATARLAALLFSGRKRRSPRSPTPSTSGADRPTSVARLRGSLESGQLSPPVTVNSGA